MPSDETTGATVDSPRIPMKVGNITRRVAGESGESACPGRDTDGLDGGSASKCQGGVSGLRRYERGFASSMGRTRRLHGKIANGIETTGSGDLKAPC